MDLGYPYTEQEIKDRAARFKQLSNSLMSNRLVQDIKYKNSLEPEIFIVERIFKKKTRRVDGLKQYLVKWEDYETPTWQFEYVLIEDLSEEVFKIMVR
jgi:hypothetical protein